MKKLFRLTFSLLELHLSNLFDTQATFSPSFGDIKALTIEADEKFSRQQFIWQAKGVN